MYTRVCMYCMWPDSKRLTPFAWGVHWRHVKIAWTVYTGYAVYIVCIAFIVDIDFIVYNIYIVYTVRIVYTVYVV